MYLFNLTNYFFFLREGSSEKKRQKETKTIEGYIFWCSQNGCVFWCVQNGNSSVLVSQHQLSALQFQLCKNMLRIIQNFDNFRPSCIWTFKQAHKDEMNTSKAEIKRHFHALQMDLVSQQMGLGLVAYICINTYAK